MSAQHTPELLTAIKPFVANNFGQALAAQSQGKSLIFCQADVLNPCWDNRPSDVGGRHWGGGDACPACNLRAAIAKAEGRA